VLSFVALPLKLLKRATLPGGNVLVSDESVGPSRGHAWCSSFFNISSLAAGKAWPEPEEGTSLPKLLTVAVDESRNKDAQFAARANDGATLIAMFHSRPLVILSPHFDDACFSIGSFLANVGRGDLVNIFTQGDYIACKDHEAKDVYELRNREDAKFASYCGLTRHDLGCEEPARRGRRPSDLTRIEDDLLQITLPILLTLDKISASFGAQRGILLAPLGVGRHVNHRAVSQFIFSNFNALRLSYDVFLYEELPYARNGLQRLLALWRARRALRLGPRQVVLLSWPQKKSLLECYPTQHAHPPYPKRFWPRALFPQSLHEAFWPVLSKSSK
jgi:hypothetical protein